MLRCRATAVLRMPDRSASTTEYAHGLPWLAAVRTRSSASCVVSPELTRRPQLGSSIDKRRPRPWSAPSSSRRPHLLALTEVGGRVWKRLGMDEISAVLDPYGG